jgi:uncharacterized protein YprB with RNaseH-like and TPR domain
MYVVDRNEDESFYSSRVFDFYFGDARLGVLDIETTGLSAKKTQIVLGGLLTPTVGGLRLRQFFSEGRQDEAELLDLYADAVGGLDVLFTYNGDHFDLPFVDERLARHHRPPAFQRILSVDLYRVLRAHSPLKTVLPNLKQKTVENYLGLWSGREDRISGADSVRLYCEYLATRAPALLRYILLHNSDDLLQLARILRIFDKLDLHEILAHTGFPVKHGESLIFIDKILLRGGALEFFGKYTALPFDYILFDETFQAAFQNETQRFSVKIPCRREKDVVFADLSELDLPAQALADHPDRRRDRLLLKLGADVRYSAINHLIKLVSRKILGKFA